MSETFDDILKSQEKELATMRSITAEVYSTLQVDEQEFLKALQDESRYSPEEWASLQKHRSILEEGLEKSLQNAYKKGSSKQNTLVQPHWIFVR
jgi:hypothetical protein